MEIGIVGFCLLVAGIVIVLIFCFAFFLELVFAKDSKESAEVVLPVMPEEDEDLDLDAMLAKLEQKSKVIEAVKVEPSVDDEDINFDDIFAKLEETAKKSSSTKEEVEKPVELVEPEVIDDSVAVVIEPEVKKETPAEKTRVIVLKAENDMPNIDYNTRLESLKESLLKLEKDLAKSTKELNKFERTTKRKQRNEKLLDRKAGELANLNLVMYNINDIKNIDPEKKQKQEELNIHIAELKESIKTAEEYLLSNKEKNANAKKLNSFLNKEKLRYLDEIKELEELIAKSAEGK